MVGVVIGCSGYLLANHKEYSCISIIDEKDAVDINICGYGAEKFQILETTFDGKTILEITQER